MTSEGTCRLVMPRSESTIASARAGGEAGVDGRLDGVALGQRGRRREQVAEAVVGADVGGGEDVAELLEQRREERPHDVAEDDRVGDLHHRRLEVHREQHVVVLGPGDLGGEELAQRGDAHDGGVDDLAGEHRHRLAEHGGRAVGGDELDAQRAVGVDDDRALVGAEVVGGHVGDVGLRVRAPRTHRVRVLAGVLLDRVRRPAVGVALAQHRVDGRPLDPVVAGADVDAPRRRPDRPGSRGRRSPAPAARRSPPSAGGSTPRCSAA